MSFFPCKPDRFLVNANFGRDDFRNSPLSRNYAIPGRESMSSKSIRKEEFVILLFLNHGSIAFLT